MVQADGSYLATRVEKVVLNSFLDIEYIKPTLPYSGIHLSGIDVSLTCHSFPIFIFLFSWATDTDILKTHMVIIIELKHFIEKNSNISTY